MPKDPKPIEDKQEITTDDVAALNLGEETPQAAQDAIDAAVAAAQTEAESRRATAQRLMDEGYAIVGAGQDDDGRHWFTARKTQDEEPVDEQVYVEEETS